MPMQSEKRAAFAFFGNRDEDNAQKSQQNAQQQQQRENHSASRKSQPMQQNLSSILSTLRSTSSSILLNQYNHQYDITGTEPLYYFPNHDVYNETIQAFRSVGDAEGNESHDYLIKLLGKSLQLCKANIASIYSNPQPDLQLERLELHELNILLEDLMLKSMENPHLTLKLFKTILEHLPSRNFQFTDNFMICLLQTVDEKWSVSTPYVLSMIMDAYLSRNKTNISAELYTYLFSLVAKSPANCSRSGHELLTVHGLLFHMTEVNSNPNVVNQRVFVAALDALAQLKDESIFQVFDEYAIEKPHLLSHRAYERIVHAALEQQLGQTRKKSQSFLASKMMHYIHLMEAQGFRIVDETLLRLILKHHNQLRASDSTHIFLRHASKQSLAECMKSVAERMQENTDPAGVNMMQEISHYIETHFLSTESELQGKLTDKLHSLESWKRDGTASYISPPKHDSRGGSSGGNTQNASSTGNASPSGGSSNNGDGNKNQNSSILGQSAVLDYLKSGKCRRIYYDSNNIMYRGEMRQYVMNRDNQAVLAYMLNLAEKINTQYNIEQSHLVFDYHEEFDGEKPKHTRLWKARPVFLTADDMLVDMAKKLSPALKRESLFVTGDIGLQQRLAEEGVFVSSPLFFSNPTSHVENVTSVETANLSRLMRL